MNISARHTAFGASLIAIAISAFSMPAFAQQDGDAEVAASEIVVTARRKDERLQDVPLTVNAVSAEDLGKLNIKRFEDVTSAVPGLTLGSNANGIGISAAVRGVNYEVNASGNNGTIEFYRNDTPISGGALMQTMFDVGQVELLRGPQGTLRGRASPSGSMTVTTHRVNLSELGGYVSATANDIGGINANGALNIPLIEGVLAVRLAAVVDENEGDRVHSIANAVKPYSRTTGERLSVRFEPTSTLHFEYTYEKLLQRIRRYHQVEGSFTNNGSSGSAGATLAGLNSVTIVAADRLAVENGPISIRQQFDIHNWQAEWAVAGQKLTYVGGFFRQKLASYEPSDKGNAIAVNNLTQPFDLGTIPLGGGFEFSGIGMTPRTQARTFSHELRLQNEEMLFGKLDYVVGGFLSTLNSPTNLMYSYLNLNGPVPLNGLFPGTGYATSNPGLAPTCMFGANPLDPTACTNIPMPPGYMLAPYPITHVTHEKSVYGNLTYHFTDATELSGGARYIYFEDETQAPGNNTVDHYNAVIYSASLKHRFSEDLMVYASTGSSWRPGVNVLGARNSLSVVQTQSPYEYAFRFLAPEKSKSYEIGFKSSLFNRKVRLNGTIFHQDYKNFVYRAPGNGINYWNIDDNGFNQFNFVAAVPVKVDGVEVEIGAQPTRNWSLGLTASYSLGKIKNGVIPCNPGSAGLIPGSINPALALITGGLDANHTVAACTANQRAGTMAPFSANLQTEYFAQVIGGVDGYLRGLVNFTGAAQGDPLYVGDEVKAHALVNLYAGIRDQKGAWDVGLYVKNLTNLNQVLSRNSAPYSMDYVINGDQGGGRVNTPFTGISMTPPREFGLSMRYAFGSR